MSNSTEGEEQQDNQSAHSGRDAVAGEHAHGAAPPFGAAARRARADPRDRLRPPLTVPCARPLRAAANQSQVGTTR